jgi:hypothetical protein
MIGVVVAGLMVVHVEGAGFIRGLGEGADY